MVDEPMLRVLPEVFRVSATSSAPLRALIAVAEGMHAPVREILDGIDRIVDPYQAPARLVPYLSRWVDLDWLTIASDSALGPERGIPTSRQRDLIANAPDLSARRGTPAGLARFLQLATGIDGFTVESVSGAFHVRVTVPTAAADQTDLVGRIVSVIKPAHLTYEVVIAA